MRRLHIFPKGRPKRVFERHGTDAIHIAPELGMRAGDERLRAVPDNASAIAALAWMGAEAFQTIVKDLARISSNIAGSDPFRRDTDTATKIYRQCPELVDSISEKLQRFDVGIDRMEITELPDIGWQILFRHSDLNATDSVDWRIFRYASFSPHIPGFTICSWNRSSDHTGCLGHGLPYKPYRGIFEWHFRCPETNTRQSQLICSLHNLSVLDDFEKEEVFIVEKNREGATQAWGVSDVAYLRRGTNLQKLYRSGALGGLPTIG